MITIILGTRPEIIKMSPIIRACEAEGLDYSILHTGQHYSYEMDRAFFDDLQLPRPGHNLDAGSGSHARQTGRIMAGIESVLQKEQPETVLVQGDTNTVLGGALAAAKLRISVGHVEAGLRSYDRSMPEEINRVLTDHISDYLFAPTPVARDHLISEGIDAKKIFTTGNTIVDAVRQNLAISRERHDVLEDMGLDRGKYFLATVHRAENVDDRDRLRGILEGLECISEEFSLPIIFPVHPRTRKRIRDFKLSLVTITETRPLGFMDFLQLEANARCVLTDSGGVQEESCILGVPCVTLRDNTERPETLDVGANILAGANAGKVRDAVRTMLSNGKTWENPFGDGRSGETIVRILTGQEV